MPTRPSQAAPCPLPTSYKIISSVNPSKKITHSLIPMSLLKPTLITIILIPLILSSKKKKMIHTDIRESNLNLLSNINDIITRTDEMKINMKKCFWHSG